MPIYVSRRQFAAALGVTVVTGLAVSPAFRRALADVVEDIKDLKPGQFTWHPERSPDGPIAIVVSIPDQLVHVYRNGIRIGVSTCSTGKPGHATPTGVFTILQKDKNHHSSAYNDAPMPNMNRLTWSGIALHAGQLPGYPASHGCVRLPMEFSTLLFGVTRIGTAVIIAGSHADPTDIIHPGLVLEPDAESELDSAIASVKGKALPSLDHADNQTSPVSIIVSGADSHIAILENGETIAEGKATITDPGTPLGSHVFILAGATGDGTALQWHGIGYDAGGGTAADSDVAVLRRIKAEDSVIAVMKARLHPGMVFVTTDLPLHPDSRSGKDFVVVTTDVGV